MQFTRRPNLPQLQQELAAAGVPFTSLGTAGNDLHTYDAAGNAAPLPQAALAVLQAHVPKRAKRPGEYRGEFAGLTAVQKQTVFARVLGILDPDLVDDDGS